MWAGNDNSGQGGGTFAPSARALLLPVAVIAIGYLAMLAVLFGTGKSDGALARLCIAALGIGVPFVLAHAVLRLMTTRLVIMPHVVQVVPGFPQTQYYSVPYGLIRSVHVERGLGGRLAGSATLRFELANGEKTAVCDIADPHAALAAIEARRVAVAGGKEEIEALAEQAVPLRHGSK